MTERREIPEGAILRSPNIPNREKSVHSRGSGNRAYVRKRHPEYHSSRADDRRHEYEPGDVPGFIPPPTETEPLPDVDDHKCELSDTTCYVIDDFRDTVAAPALTAGTTWSGVAGYQASFVQNHYLADLGFSYRTLVSAALSSRVNSYIGSWYIPHTFKPSWSTCTCFLCNTFSGWIEEEVWYEVTVPAHPANMAGITFQHGGLAHNWLAAENGLNLVFATSRPTNIRMGTKIGHMHPVDNTLQEYFIPGNLIPAEGGTFYVGWAPNWHCDATWPAHCCGWTWPRTSGCKNSGYAYTYNGVPVMKWQTWTTQSSDWGKSPDISDLSRWDGGLPREMGGNSDGSVEMTAGTLKLTAPAGAYAQRTLRYSGSESTNPSDADDDPVEEPWTEEGGVNMKMRFRVTTAGSLTEVGRRQVSLKFHTGKDLITATAYLGDTDHNEGLFISTEDNSATVEKEIVEGSWMWLSVDTRNSDYVRGKLWVESGMRGGGEPAKHDVYFARSSDTEVPSEDDYLEIELWAGNATGADQIIEVSHLVACGPGKECDWIIELLGQANGTDVSWTTTQPFKRNSLQYMPDGFDVKPVAVDPAVGTFKAVDPWPAAEGAFIFVRYLAGGTDET